MDDAMPGCFGLVFLVGICGIFASLVALIGWPWASLIGGVVLVVFAGLLIGSAMCD